MADEFRYSMEASEDGRREASALPPSFRGCPWSRPSPWELPKQYRGLCADTPVVEAALRSGQMVWLVGSHDFVRRVLTAPEVSAEHSHPAYPQIFPVSPKRLESGERPKLSYSGMDGAEHAFHRRMIAGEFSGASADRLRPAIEIAAREQADAYAEMPQPADLVTGFARPLVARAIGGVLGLPDDVVAECAGLTDIVLGSGEDDDAVEKASSRLREIVSSTLEQKRWTPSDGLIGRLVARYDEAGLYDRDQIIQLAKSLITAGLETSANMIALSVMTLLHHPRQAALLKSERSLLPGAVLELLRFLSIADIVTARVTTEEVRLGPYTIPAGCGVLALTASANRDPAAFVDPDVLDIRRRAERHVAFGWGPHRCLGQHIARVILESALAALLDRFVVLRPVISGAADGHLSSGVICGVERLPLAWDLG
jgi:cytochrome P450